jgi:hypothetical protein
MRPVPAPTAFICGTYINEYGILRSLQRLRWPGRIVAVKEPYEGRVLADLCTRWMEVLEVKLKVPEDLIPLLEGQLQEGQEGVVFFCDERFLGAFARYAKAATRPRLRHFGPTEASLRTIVNRPALYAHIDRLGKGSVPRTLPSDTRAPLVALGSPMIVRPNQTWVGLRKNPRAALVSNAAELAAVERRYERAGMTRAEWCYQEVLSLLAEDNVSVCGWHAPGEQHYLVTRKVLSFPALMGNGDVCEILPPNPTLTETTAAVLDSLAYEGPFETEFVRDPRTGTFRIIEINPRFWMQNELVNLATGDLLVRRYTGLDGGAGAETPVPVWYWVNRVVAFSRLLRLDLRIIRYLFSGRSVAIPSVWLTIRYIPFYVRRRLAASRLGPALGVRP